MAKGTIAMVVVLFLVTASVIVLAGFIALIFSNLSFSEGVWAGIMHTIDAGTITGTDTSDVGFVIIMSVVTLCGLFITSILIGIITTGFEEKLTSLKKGNSRVVEKNHTIILGFNDNIYTVISELILANESSKNECIVVLSPESKEEVEEAIKNQVGDYKTTRIVCRTGATTDINMLEKCGLETCRSIIINEQDDFMTTKAILAINNFYDSVNRCKDMPCIVASVDSATNFDAAQIAGEGNVEIMLTEDTISRIIAQTCRQSGLSEVMTELFDFGGDELYFENFSQLAGKKFGDILLAFDKAIVFGYKRNGVSFLNPDKDTLLEKDDELILLMGDNGASQPKLLGINTNSSSDDFVPAYKNTEKDNILILGINSKLIRILKELDQYSAVGSTITIADENVENISIEENVFENIVIKRVECDTNERNSLDRLTDGDVDNIVLLSDDECDMEQSDAKMLLKLIHLRDISEKKNLEFNITSEMKNASNQKLARVAKVNDFVIGNYIVNMMMAQISENRDLADVFRELLHPNGSEIYIRNASYYLNSVEKSDFFAITKKVSQRNEIVIGYKKQISDNDFEIVINPLKSEKVTFTNKDCLIVLSSD